jgi:hypothetical protein
MFNNAKKETDRSAATRSSHIVDLFSLRDEVMPDAIEGALSLQDIAVGQSSSGWRSAIAFKQLSSRQTLQ